MLALTWRAAGLRTPGACSMPDQAEQPAPGLYAAGGAMGSLQGGPCNGYSRGWSEAATFAMLADEHPMAILGQAVR